MLRCAINPKQTVRHFSLSFTKVCINHVFGALYFQVKHLQVAECLLKIYGYI